MKWLVYLFSLYVLLLSGVLCDADDDCCSNFIEQTGHRQESEAGKNHKPLSPCSPFFAYGAVHAVVVPEAYVVKPLPLLPVAKLHSDYKEPQLHDFSPVIWQPSKQV